MPLLEEFKLGSLGVTLKPGKELVLTNSNDDLAQFEAPNQGVAFWLYFFPDLHMDLSAERLDAFRSSAELHARRMFIETSETNDFDGPLRTDDAKWSPLVDFETTTVCDAPILQTVHRMLYQPGREIMMGHLLMPLERGLLEIRVAAIDSTTGFRESAIMMMQDDMDAIDPRIYDAVEMDEKFPEHCLSRTRKGLQTARSWISEVSQPAPTLTQCRVSLPKLKGAFTPPRGFVHCDSGDGIEFFKRVSFCGTDGVEAMLVGAESQRRVAAEELLALAKSVSRRNHEDSNCDDIELKATKLSHEGQSAVQVVVDYVGNQGPSRNFLFWFLDAKGRARSFTFLDVGLGPNFALEEAKAAAHSWESLRGGWLSAVRRKI